MKHLLTAIACCLAMAGSAQSDAYPFNPDSDGDGFITVEDLLVLLTDFGLAAELETCFKGEIYKVRDWNTFYIPGDCGTLIVTRPYGGINTTILNVEPYSDGDVIHVCTDAAYGPDGTSIFRYIDYDGILHTFASFGPGIGEGFTKFTFDNGAWSWDGSYYYGLAPTSP